MKRTIEQRIKAKSLVTADGCWDWTGARNAKKYGVIRVENQKMLAHRVSYSVFVGEIKPGSSVLHRCGNSFCVNPEHLFQGNTAAFCGEEHPMARLTAPQVLQIVANEGAQRAIARKYGVSKGLVWAIKKGVRWGHLTGIERGSLMATEAV